MKASLQKIIIIKKQKIMKSITNKIAGYFSISLIMLVLLSSCTDDNSNNNINDVVKQGEWN
jgi:hypothetical protein